MTTSNPQGAPAGKVKQVLSIVILSVGFLFAIGTILILVESAGPASLPDTPASPRTAAAAPSETPASTLASQISPGSTPASPLSTPPSPPAASLPPPTPSSSIPGASAQPTTPHINVPTVQYPTIPPSAPAYTLPIQGIASSGVSGTVTFQDVAGAVAILLHVDGLPDETLVPVELLHGSCAAAGPLAYPLVSPDAGESETDLSINLQQLNAQRPLAVMIYRSAQDRTALACGDVP